MLAMQEVKHDFPDAHFPSNRNVQRASVTKLTRCTPVPVVSIEFHAVAHTMACSSLRQLLCGCLVALGFMEQSLLL